MGELIAFRSTRSTPRHNAVPPCGGADILIFTGVRYERFHEAETAGEAKPSAPKKRISRSRRPKKSA